MTKTRKSKRNPPRQASAKKKVTKQNLPSSKIIKAIKKIDPVVFILGVIILFYFSLTLSCLYQRYIYLEMKESPDPAAFMQISWSIVKGIPFTISVLEHAMEHFSHNFLGRQLPLTMAVFSPLFLFTSSGVPFLIIQILIISLGAIPLYLLAKGSLKNKWLALLIATAYLFNPATYETFEKFGFRVETLFILPLFAMFYFLDRDNYWGAGISLLFALFTKHNMIMMSFMLGLYYLLVDRKRWRFGIFCLAVAVGYYIIGVKIVISKFQLDKTVSFKWFADFGQSPKEILVNMALHPGKIWGAISPLEWKYSYRIFFSAGFLALLHPVFWVCLPQLIMNAIMPDYHSIYCAWHWAVVVPFLFVGIVYTMKWILDRFHQYSYPKYILSAILVWGLFYNFADYNKTVLSADRTFYYKQKNIDTKKIIEQLSVIEPDASVMASGQLLWFLGGRERLYVARTKFHDEVDYIAVLLPMGQDNMLNVDRYLMKEIPNTNSKYLKKYTIISRSPNLIIFKRKSPAKVPPLSSIKKQPLLAF